MPLPGTAHFQRLLRLLDLEADAEKQEMLRRMQRRSPAEAEASGFEIDTVDGFQGREKEVDSACIIYVPCCINRRSRGKFWRRILPPKLTNHHFQLHQEE